MLILGLTGGIACGKSTVTRMFAALGAEVIDADEIAHEVMRPGTKEWKRIVDYFGKSILNKDSSINRMELGKVVFSSVKKRKKLEEIVHPVVVRTIQGKIRKLATCDLRLSTIVVIDAPLLIEANLTSLVDKLVVVSAWRRIQMRRLKENGLSGSEAVKRIDSQLSLKEKIKLADYVIRNNGNLADLENQVEKVWKEILSKNR